LLITVGYCDPRFGVSEATFFVYQDFAKARTISRSGELEGAVCDARLSLRGSCPLPIILTDTEGRFCDMLLLRCFTGSHSDSRSKTDRRSGGVVGIGPSRQWTELTVTN